MKTERKTLVIIDGHAIIHRAYHALPPLTVADGTMVNAVFGFTSMLLKILQDIHPTYVAVCFDVAGGTFRDELYTEYKATREKADDALYAQIPLVYDVVHAFGIPIYEQAGYEADDMIGTLSRVVTEETTDTDVLVVTGDRDLLQLVKDSRVKVYLLGRGMSEFTAYDEQKVREVFGFAAKQIPDFKALMGDPSDNIPGVKGIGKKTATDILIKERSIEELYTHIDTNTTTLSPSVIKKLVADKDAAFLSKQLATIVRDVPNAPISLPLIPFHDYDQQAIIALLKRFEFFSLIKRLPGSEKKQEEKTTIKKEKPRPYTLVRDGELADTVAVLKKQKMIVCKEVLAGTNSISDPLHALVFVTEKKTYSIDIAALSKKNKEQVFALFEQKNLFIIGHDLKQLIKVLLRYGTEIQAQIFDTMIASYINNATTRAHDVRSIILRETAIDIGEEQQASLFADDVQHIVTDYQYLFEVYEVQRKKLKEAQQEELFFSLEMNVTFVLARMELTGIKVDTELLSELSVQVAKEITEMVKEIHGHAGEVFNVNSSVQLRDILFDRLALPTEGIKKGKTGYSTAASELEKLKNMHPIISLIEEHRELTKLQNTYIDVLPTLVNAQTGRIHTSYNQAVAATGRLSSTDPNLQNIPIRSEYGKKIREAFLSEDGYDLVAADYSQIELRIVASLAQDTQLMSIFEKGEDVHKATAAVIHGVSLEEVTPEMRRSAKEVNFGVLYGMGPFGLAARTGMSHAEAREFIKKYFTSFAGVKTYLEDVVNKGKRDGYTETLYGRRRYIPELNSPNHQLRTAAERMAVNMPIQGTQADIVKLAMIAVDELCEKQSYYVKDDVRFLLQVHDELVFEIKNEASKKIATEIKQAMEAVVTLAVPVIADINIGKRWGAWV